MLFAVTVNCTARNGFENDVLVLQACVEIMKRHHCEISDIHYELQPQGMHNLHFHTTIASDRPINFARLYKEFAELGCRGKITQLLSKEDFQIWKRYCQKENYDVAYEYAESVRSDRYNLFKLCERGARKLAQCCHCDKKQIDDQDV